MNHMMMVKVVRKPTLGPDQTRWVCVSSCCGEEEAGGGGERGGLIRKKLRGSWQMLKGGGDKE